MKLLVHGLVVVVVVAGGTACQTAHERSTPDARNGQVQVTFENPDRFTDIRSTHAGGPNEHYLESLRTFIAREASRYLESDESLALTFRDIDLAGDYEPWRDPRTSDVRIMRDIYPPRLEFTYVVHDAEGNIRSEGHENLGDVMYTWRLNLTNRDDPLRHEKELLRDWMRRAM